MPDCFSQKCWNLYSISGVSVPVNTEVRSTKLDLIVAVYWGICTNHGCIYFSVSLEQTQPLIPVLKIFLLVSHWEINLPICYTPHSLKPLDSTWSAMTRAPNKGWIGLSCGHIVFRIKKLNSTGNGAGFNCSMMLTWEVSRQSSFQEIEAVKRKGDLFQMSNFTSKGLVLQGRGDCNCYSLSLCRGL